MEVGYRSRCNYCAAGWTKNVLINRLTNFPLANESRLTMNYRRSTFGRNFTFFIEMNQLE